MKWPLFVFCFLLLAPAQAQQSNLRPDREGYKLTVLVDAESVYEDSVQSGPFIKGPNILQLYPGERVFIEVTESRGSITTFTSVRENLHPERTLEISFIQNATGRVHEGMILKIVNPFKKDLTYSATTFLLQQNKWVETGVLPVRAGLVSYETWADPIVTIALGDWKFSGK